MEEEKGDDQMTKQRKEKEKKIKTKERYQHRKEKSLDQVKNEV